MRRFVNHTLLWGVLGLLTGCGEILGEAGSISGTLSAPVGGDVADTHIFACYNNERDCAMLGDVEITQTGTSAPYQIDNLPLGSYSVYALKNSDGEDYVGWYGLAEDQAKQPLLVTPPATEIDIQMIIVPNTGRSSLPEKVQELSTEVGN